MPARVFELPAAHLDDELDYGFTFEVFGTGDDVATYAVPAVSGVTIGTPTASGQTVTVRLGPVTTAGTYRIICTAVSDAGQEATIEADWTVSDPD